MPRRIRTRYGDRTEILELNDDPVIENDPVYVICPYCGSQKGDCWEWVKEYPVTDECEECGGTYTYHAEYDVTYYTKPETPPPNPHEREITEDDELDA